MSEFSKLSFLLVVAALVSACSSSVSTHSLVEQVEGKDFSNMYLRGNFTWFEVDENYKLLATSSNTYEVTINLIADGQPYDFKVADPHWSMRLNCGTGFEMAALELDVTYDLVCAADSLNLQFKPSETADYIFTLDASDQDIPTLTVTRKSD